LEADFVIVGGGSAGAVLAATLTEHPGCRVTLVERGHDFTERDLPDELRYAFCASAADDPNCPITERGEVLRRLVMLPHLRWYEGHKRGGLASIPRGEVMGGSSSVNAGVYLWGVVEDFDEWVARGNTGWSYDRVRRAFAELETDRDFPAEPHGVDGPIIVERAPRSSWHASSQAFLEACRAQGHREVSDFNDLASRPDGVGALPFNVSNGVRISSLLGFLTPEVRRRPNLRIIPATLVTRILFEGTRAVGVATHSADGEQIIRGHEIMLCAGAIGSPQLLMLSGIGPADQLRRLGIPIVHDLPVGERLEDHPYIEMRWVSKGRVELSDARETQLALRYTAPGSRHRTDLHLIPKLVSFETVDGVSRQDHHAINIAVQLYRPVGAGRLQLASRDPRQQPRLDYRYLEDPEDRARMREGVRHAFRIMTTAPLRNFVVSPDRLSATCCGLSADEARSDERLDAWMYEHVDTSQHSSTTCMMGPADDRAAVVDPEARVHGLDGLRVIDASILPTCLRANTNAPTMMVARHLGRQLQQGPS
jgi:choline dehydrogenase